MGAGVNDGRLYPLPTLLLGRPGVARGRYGRVSDVVAGGADVGIGEGCASLLLPLWLG